MSRNLVRDWENGEDLDDVTFEKFTGKQTREISDEDRPKNSHSQERKEKEAKRWETLEDE
jgi:hypothetical protein